MLFTYYFSKYLEKRLACVKLRATISKEDDALLFKIENKRLNSEVNRLKIKSNKLSTRLLKLACEDGLDTNEAMELFKILNIDATREK